ncbi:uncharacterized protein LOC114267122 [Camellia sinensis]|uniref:uncharacterized protein LOC114267122 n=1 Tax=Camellia sinensis TaxID=4442 RepID=UPI0010360D07|nr:uncharacterized protein LOC114267122 [Camellia sinensis]
MKGHMRFGKKGKLTPRYIGQFQILERLGPIAYCIALPLGMEQVHNVFHVSMLRGYLRDPFHVIDYHRIALDEDMMYEEWPVQIIDWQVKQLRNKNIPMMKVEWREHYGKEATWEKEEEMRQRYPHLFPSEGERTDIGATIEVERVEVTGQVIVAIGIRLFLEIAAFGLLESNGGGE